MGASFKNGKFSLKQLSGGKMDDITVMVALVDLTNAAPAPAPAAEQEQEQQQQPAGSSPTAAAAVAAAGAPHANGVAPEAAARQ